MQKSLVEILKSYEREDLQWLIEALESGEITDAKACEIAAGIIYNL